MQGADVQKVRDVSRGAVERLLGRLGLSFQTVAETAVIPGSYWGDCEAGIIGHTVFASSETPVHSVLHETCHVVCMDPVRRAALHTNAGGDDLEEAAVCYLQVLLADALPGVGRDRLMKDMDCWGYSFRLGSTHRWFREDADDARSWLIDHGLVDADGVVTYRLRR